MYVLAAVLVIGLLTWLFADLLQQQRNPNQSPGGSVDPAGNITLMLQRNREGHYVASGQVNGADVEFLLDTGATAVAVPAELAKKLDLAPGRPVKTVTANGIATAYLTKIDELRLGEIVERDIVATLVPNLPGGQILLGMSFLKRLDFSQRGDTLLLESQNQ